MQDNRTGKEVGAEEAEAAEAEAAGESETGIRLAKWLAYNANVSRRQAEVMITEGHVTVDDQLVTTPVYFVKKGQRVTLSGEEVWAKEGKEREPLLLLYHKPRGYVVSTRSQGPEPTIFDQLPQMGHRWIAVGRLDLETEGLLLLTNNGGLARFLELPSSEFERVYRAKVFGILSEEGLNALEQGVTIEGTAYRGCHITVDQSRGKQSWLTITLLEGKNREIRKLMTYIGLTVRRLIRTSYGPYQLGELPVGYSRLGDVRLLEKKPKGRRK